MKKRRARKKGNILKSVIILFAFILLIAGTAFIALGTTAFSNRIFPNVYVDTIPLGGLTGEEALEKLKEYGWDEHTERTLEVSSFQGTTVEIDPVEAGVVIDAASAVNAAVRYGRDSDPIRQLQKYLLSRKQTVDVHELSTMLNDSYIDEKVCELQEKLDASLPSEEFIFTEQTSELKVFKGQSNLELDADLMRREIIRALDQGIEKFSFTILRNIPAAPDFQAIYDQIYSEMQNAYITDNSTHTIIEERTGYRFDIDEARRLYREAAPADWVVIPVEKTEPEVTKESIEETLFRDLLGAVTTKYNNSGENRCSNVRLAASLVNGTVLWPGEEFSFNNVVGERTIERGFLIAPAYAGYDDVKDEVGGGVCQVSTGIYASALYAFLEIRSHTSHLHPPNYIQLGTDATVTIPEGGGRAIDFRFRNNKTYPIKIISYCEETVLANNSPFKTVTVEIWGTLEPDDYMPIEFDNSYAGIYDYDRVIEPAYPDREGFKIKFTHEETEFEDDYGRGIRTLTHRKVYNSQGTLVEDKIINPTYSAGFAMDTYYYRS